jgi:hypothetical protein
MNIFRMGHDEWDRVLVNGLSWDLLPLAFWAGVAVIIGHLMYRAFKGGRRGQGG